MKPFTLFIAAAAVVIAKMSVVRAAGLLRGRATNSVLFNDALNDGISKKNRHGRVADQWYLKFTLDGVGVQEWNKEDLAAFDHSVQAAYDAVHGGQDGYFWTGQQEKKIKRKSSMSLALAEGDLGMSSLRKISSKKDWNYIFDVYALFDVTCTLCRNDDDDLGLASGLTRKSPGMAHLSDVAEKVCLYLSQSGDNSFGGVRACTIVVLTNEEVALVI